VSRASRLRVATLVLAWAAWEVLARSGLVFEGVVPSSLAVLASAARQLGSAPFYAHLWRSVEEIGLGFAIGSAAGVGIGTTMGMSVFFGRMMHPYIHVLAPTPKIIFLPIIFLMFGVGMESKMAKGAFSGFFPMVFSTTLGMLLINPVLLRVGKSFQLNQWQTITKIYLPAMVNPVIVGLRLGLGVTIIGILIAEIKFSDGGVGFRLIQYYDQFKIAPMYAMLILIFALAAAGNFGMTKLQDRFNWHISTTGKKSSSHGNLGT